jgi:alkylation response protein AidB-like acyl-CoA dehydrogenase
VEYFLTDEQKMIVELSRKITDEYIIPQRAKLEEEEIFPLDILKKMAEADLYGLYIPEEYGGFGGGVLDFILAVEEFSRGCIGVSVSFAANALGIYPVLAFGNEEQKKKYLPQIASGAKQAAFALTEANAGSDAGGVQTIAELKGDHYVLNGTKQWITNGGDADIYTVIAITDKNKGARGASAFVVEKGTEGFTFGKRENKLGIRASSTRELIFQDCKIPKENLLSKEGMGFIVAMKNLDHSRPGIAAQGVGLGQGAMELAVKYARERVQFGKPISSFQVTQHKIANMATEIEAARALLYQTARNIDAGVKDFSRESAMCKLYATDVANKVVNEALQIYGGYGYMKEYPIEKMFRDAKILQIYEGTNEIQRNVIALEVIKESSKKDKQS